MENLQWDWKHTHRTPGNWKPVNVWSSAATSHAGPSCGASSHWEEIFGGASCIWSWAFLSRESRKKSTLDLQSEQMAILRSLSKTAGRPEQLIGVPAWHDHSTATLLSTESTFSFLKEVPQKNLKCMTSRWGIVRMPQQHAAIAAQMKKQALWMIGRWHLPRLPAG